MNRKTCLTTTITSLLSALVLFSAPAQAQLLGGAGNLTGNMSGQIGRGTTGLGGALGGDGRLSGNLPRPETGRLNGALERIGERTSDTAQTARDRAVAAKDKVSDKAADARDKATETANTVANTSASGGGSAAGSGSITTPARSVGGGGAASGSGSLSRNGASAEASGSGRASTQR